MKNKCIEWEPIGEAVLLTIHEDEKTATAAITMANLQSMIFDIQKGLAKDIAFMAPRYVMAKSGVFLRVLVLVLVGYVVKRLLGY